MERYFEILNKYEKFYSKELDSKYEDIRDTNQKEKTDIINNKLNLLPIHEGLSKKDLKKNSNGF